ncbi:holo-ACP synthase [Desertibacillus haloalkaliphilus]|uniref:holo-ACP synthase n=1 Tax=Desertibacillus haloalkaliphilus TaxID=1328930 RepID=UPI001C264B79|nr:holo-ACP synthase [Desertibacillus haloalkaliphilus]MBU8908769.1 holo-ACP synthase [Desertibacillus haloalkaliphilus]
MITGIGIDIVELARIDKLIKQQPRFVSRILTPGEQETYRRLPHHRSIEFVAGRFAAKEAFVKAVGTGISKQVGWQDIEISNDHFGKPVVSYPTEDYIHLSISHSKEYAIAQVVIERLSS